MPLVKRYVQTSALHRIETWTEVEVDPAECGPGDSIDERACDLVMMGEGKRAGFVIHDAAGRPSDLAPGYYQGVSGELPPLPGTFRDVLSFLEAERDHLLGSFTVAGDPATMDEDQAHMVGDVVALITRLKAATGL